MARKRKYAMIIDTKRCVGCSACVFACKSENNVPEGFCRDWIVQRIEGEAEKLMRGREVVQDKVHAGTKPKLFWLT